MGRIDGRWGRQDWSREDELGSHRFNMSCEDLGSDMGGRTEKEQT